MCRTINILVHQQLQTCKMFGHSLQASWLPEIQRMVQTVDSHFQRMLRGMGCNGQVSLYCGCPDFDGCNAFEKYAIHIRVKFRDEEELQLLTANRQSGGERAVCTILYIVALQVTPMLTAIIVVRSITTEPLSTCWRRT